VPEQAEAYAGTSLGFTMTCRAAIDGIVYLSVSVNVMSMTEYEVGVIVMVVALSSSISSYVT
jgi:hypothetical protein